jgi:hypothetical protein
MDFRSTNNSSWGSATYGGERRTERPAPPHSRHAAPNGHFRVCSNLFFTNAKVATHRCSQVVDLQAAR